MKHLGHSAQQPRIPWAIPRLREIVLAVQPALVDVRQNQHAPTVDRVARGIGHIGGREAAERLVIVVQRQSQLVQRALRHRRDRPPPRVIHPVGQVRDARENDAPNGENHVFSQIDLYHKSA